MAGLGWRSTQPTVLHGLVQRLYDGRYGPKVTAARKPAENAHGRLGRVVADR
jgi:hypothetical protein